MAAKKKTAKRKVRRVSRSQGIPASIGNVIAESHEEGLPPMPPLPEEKEIPPVQVEHPCPAECKDKMYCSGKCMLWGGLFISLLGLLLLFKDYGAITFNLSAGTILVLGAGIAMLVCAAKK